MKNDKILITCILVAYDNTIEYNSVNNQFESLPRKINDHLPLSLFFQESSVRPF